MAERPLPVNQLPPRAGPTVAPRARLLRTFGVAKVRKRAVSIGQHRGVPRRGRLREPGHDGRRYQSRSRGQRLAARWLATAPATRRRHGGYGRTFPEAECEETQALAVTQVPRCPRADRGAPSPELPFRRLGPDSVPPPAPAPPVGCRDTSHARGSAWIRRPPRGSRPGPRASPAGPTELTLAEPETARAPGVATHHYSKRFRVTGGFRGCHRMPHTARRKGTQPRGYLS